VSERCVVSPSVSIPEMWRHWGTSPTDAERRRILRPDHQVKERGGVAVTQDDLLYRFRLRVFAMAADLGNVRAACRAMGIHPSTYYRWKRQLDRHGPEILRPRERRVPRMANATSPLIEQRVVAFALGHPGFGPPASPPSSPGPSGAASSCHPTACGGCWVATACPPAPDATAWSPVTRRHRPLSGPSHDPSGTWTWSTLGSWSSWTEPSRVHRRLDCWSPTVWLGASLR
jgi:hypothetical protein